MADVPLPLAERLGLTRRPPTAQGYLRIEARRARDARVHALLLPIAERLALCFGLQRTQRDAAAAASATSAAAAASATSAAAAASATSAAAAAAATSAAAAASATSAASAAAASAASAASTASADTLGAGAEVPSNVDNQAAHLAALLAQRLDRLPSELFTSEGGGGGGVTDTSFAPALREAVAQVHDKLFETYFSWVAHVRLRTRTTSAREVTMGSYTYRAAHFGAANAKDADAGRQWVCNAQLHRCWLELGLGL